MQWMMGKKTRTKVTSTMRIRVSLTETWIQMKTTWVAKLSTVKWALPDKWTMSKWILEYAEIS